MKVGIVGSGNVASSLVHYLAGSDLPIETVVSARDQNKAKAAVMDAASAYPLDANKVQVLPLNELRHADLLVLGAGVQPYLLSKGELTQANVQLTKEILDQMQPRDSAFIIALATPVDTLTAIVQNYLGGKGHPIGESKHEWLRP